MKIGILDSGVGGLTVLGELYHHFPSHSFIYYGDTARSPWGSKSKEELKTISKEIIDFLIEKGSEIIINACNTTHTQLGAELQAMSSVPMVGLPEAAAQEAARLTKTNRIGVLATQGT